MLNERKNLDLPVVHDIDHPSRDILSPKFHWMRASYLLFAVGLIDSGRLFLTAPDRM
ncbi:MAG: hypothetical protein ACI81V_000441 [Lentimonas sp.]|jgi:hypothetical protein